VIHLDTSALVDSLAGPRRQAARLRALIEEGERITFSTIVLYEWLRGPRTRDELAAQEALFPRESAVAFGAAEAALASQWYSSVPRARGREIDLAIAACAATHDATLWTLNREDFRDVPGVRLLD
jgi:predicted nucleic acid-binding protein